LANTWAILNNRTTYGEDVDEFRPERFLNADGTLDPKVPYPDAAFGFGRRVCAGRALARSSIWLFVASVLACFDISKALNENGEEIDPSTDYLDGFVISPQPFECIIQPRSKVVEELIRQKVAGAVEQ
jgi:cytochrome P450